MPANAAGRHWSGMDTHPALTPSALLAAWRERAQFLADFGDANSAKLWILAAAELERALATVADETLSLVEAARISGFTADYLGHLVKTGKIKNVGRKGAPRIRRADLPQKNSDGPGRPRRRPSVDIRRIAHSLREEQ
jgi:hypothetical protein